MPTQRHQTHIPLLHINGNLPQRLSRISVKRHIVLLANSPNFLHRLNYSNFIIHRHHRNKPRIGPNRSPKLLQINQPVRFNRKIGDLETFLLEVAAGIEHALVLRLRGYHVPLLVLIEMHDALDGDVVGLGRTGGEDYLLGGRAYEGRYLSARVFHGVVGFPAVEVGARVRVSETREIERQHRVNYTRVHRGCCLDVQIEGSSGDSNTLHRHSRRVVPIVFRDRRLHCRGEKLRAEVFG
ncbi:hypothetical protein V8G54_016912 [Vigna mungo]|uniref:Uncharacterized protein n=1 Tax=Vigna mungo TaxID=3915 RepID=A0AAQ3NPP7_VIGMU